MLHNEFAFAFRVKILNRKPVQRRFRYILSEAVMSLVSNGRADEIFCMGNQILHSICSYILRNKVHFESTREAHQNALLLRSVHRFYVIINWNKY